MKFLILQLLALMVPCSLMSQSTSFEYIFNQNKTDFAEIAIETPDSGFLIAANQWGLAYPRRNSIIKISKKGILIKTLTFGNDSAPSYIKRLLKTNYGFLAVGAQNVVYGKSYLWLIKMDKQLNVISEKSHEVPNILQELIADIDRDSNIIIGGSISYKKNYLPRLFGAKVAKNGDLVFLTYQFPSDSISAATNLNNPYIGYFDYMITMQDSARHVFFDGFKMVSVDSSFDVVHKISMPYVPSFYFLLNPTVLRLTDTTYYVAGEGEEGLSRKKTLYFSTINLNGRYANFKMLGLQDTSEHVATQHSLDTTKNGDIYIGSTFNFPLYCQNPPLCNDTSYFVLQKLDKQQNALWKKRYGKDGQYVMFGLLATRDGGCLMYGYRYTHDVPKRFEGYVLKVDGNGLMTSETAIPMPQQTITAYPNPSNGQLNFKKEDPSVSNRFDVNIFDISGKLVFQKRETNLTETFDLSHLSEGNYMYQITSENAIVAVGKWVKIKN